MYNEEIYPSPGVLHRDKNKKINDDHSFTEIHVNNIVRLYTDLQVFYNEYWLFYLFYKTAQELIKVFS